MITVGLRRRSILHKKSDRIRKLRVESRRHVGGKRIGPTVGSVQHAEQIQLITGSWHDIIAKLSIALPIYVIAIIKVIATRLGYWALTREHPKESRTHFMGQGTAQKHMRKSPVVII